MELSSFCEEKLLLVMNNFDEITSQLSEQNRHFREVHVKSLRRILAISRVYIRYNFEKKID